MTRGGVACVATQVGVFYSKNHAKKDELEIYFTCLKNQLKTFSFPIAFQLYSGQHRILVAYDPQNDSWLFIDVNTKNADRPILVTSNITWLTSYVRDAFFSANFYEILIMTTLIFTTQNHSAQLKQQIDLLEHENRDFQALFQITPEKARHKNRCSEQWVDHAVRYGLVEIVQALHQYPHSSKYKEFEPHLVQIRARERDSMRHYFQDDYQKTTYQSRYKMIEAAAVLYQDLGSFFVFNKGHTKLQFNFLLNILNHAPLGDSQSEEQANLSQSVRDCYRDFIHQGHPANLLFSKQSRIASAIKPLISDEEIHEEKGSLQQIL